MSARGTISFDIPFARIRAFVATDDCGLKSPSTSDTDGVNARESQMNNILSSVAPRMSSIVSSTNSTDGVWIYISDSKSQPARSKNAGSIADSESKYTTPIPIFCAFAAICAARKDLPVASSPASSVTFPTGIPAYLPLQIIESSQRDPVGIHNFTSVGLSSRRSCATLRFAFLFIIALRSDIDTRPALAVALAI